MPWNFCRTLIDHNMSSFNIEKVRIKRFNDLERFFGGATFFDKSLLTDSMLQRHSQANGRMNEFPKTLYEKQQSRWFLVSKRNIHPLATKIQEEKIILVYSQVDGYQYCLFITTGA